MPSLKYIMKLFFCVCEKVITSAELIKLVTSYDPQANVDLIKTAYIFSMEAHGIQKRASGVPYFNHPAEVAKMLAEFKMDSQTIATGLLHDVLEDTNVSVEELEEIFGSEIAFLVQGVTKLSKINYASSKAHQSENFRKFIFAIAADIRVLIIKLVDRLHNMQTINFIPSIEKRHKISLETLELYAPLAEKIGFDIIKEQLEDIAFYNLHPNEYRCIADRVEQLSNKDHNFVNDTIVELHKSFAESKINAEISGRKKTVYSVWKKMQKRNVTLEQVHDIIAFRIIVESLENCYAALGIIHTKFPIKPGRFKDYISVPKFNNYRSLHTMVIGPMNHPIEVQIRTKEMHDIAEHGLAAHWSYKKGDVLNREQPQSYNWIKNLITIIQQSGSPEEVMDNSKLEMFEDEVFCFSPTGDLITLPKGATAIDFAYRIHTDVGNTCIGVKINEKMSPLKTILKNGDRVDILTSSHQHPEALWENFSITGKAKACIKKFIKSKEKAEFIALGLHLVNYVFSAGDKIFDEQDIDYSKYGCTSIKTFYYNVGRGTISLETLCEMIPIKPNKLWMNEDSICLIDFTPGIAVHFAECCHPMTGDKVIGAQEINKGLVVHLSDCEKLEKYTNTFIKVKWNQDDEMDAEFIARLMIVMQNKTDSFAIITNIISSNEASITNLRIEHRSMDFFDLVVDIKVTNTEHLGEILASLRSCSVVRSVKRL